MKIHLIDGVEHNFGDELNTWLWPELFPTLFDDTADGVRFVGTGTLLDERLPSDGLNVVLGSGGGHARPPDMRAAPAHWRVYGVRGPLTARLLSLPDGAALTDPAILVARHPRWRRRAPGGGTGVVFVPHWRSLPFGQWREACAMAGLDFVDPREDSRRVVDRIAAARLVIAESMHAAIVADALRVPWIPIVLSREVAPFKWTDWTATVDLEYAPLLLAPSSPLEALRDEVLRHSSFACIGEYHDQARRNGGPRELAWSRAQLLGEHARACRRRRQAWRRRASAWAEAALQRLVRLAPVLRERLAPGVHEHYREQAATQLSQVLAAPPQLSSDRAHQRALIRCEAAVERLRQDCRAGRIDDRPARSAQRTADAPQAALAPHGLMNAWSAPATDRHA